MPSQRRVKAGTGYVQARPFADSSQLYTSGNTAGLRARFQADGYLFIRGLLPKEGVMDARAFLLEHLHAQAPHKLDAAGKLLPGAASIGLLARHELTGSVWLNQAYAEVITPQAGPGPPQHRPGRAGVSPASAGGGRPPRGELDAVQPYGCFSAGQTSEQPVCRCRLQRPPGSSGAEPWRRTNSQGCTWTMCLCESS